MATRKTNYSGEIRCLCINLLKNDNNSNNCYCFHPHHYVNSRSQKKPKCLSNLSEIINSDLQKLTELKVLKLLMNEQISNFLKTLSFPNGYFTEKCFLNLREFYNTMFIFHSVRNVGTFFISTLNKNGLNICSERPSQLPGSNTSSHTAGL